MSDRASKADRGKEFLWEKFTPDVNTQRLKRLGGSAISLLEQVVPKKSRTLDDMRQLSEMIKQQRKSGQP